MMEVLPSPHVLYQQTRDVDSMLAQFWADGVDDRPTLNGFSRSSGHNNRPLRYERVCLPLH